MTTTTGSTRPRPSAALALLACLLAALLLAACSTGGSDDGGASDTSDASGSGPASTRPDTGSDGGSDSGADSGAGSEAAEDRATGSAPREAARTATPPDLERAVVSTGTVSLRADDVAATRREVQRIVDASRGQVSEEDTESDDDGRTVYARLVLRVPSAAFDDVMAALEKTAGLRSSQRTSEDVTTQVIDTDVRVRAQEASLERVEALLARARQLREIVWIESQLTQRQAELDSLRQQQAWLADQTSLSTITVDIERTPAERKEDGDEDRAGFLAGLQGGLDALGGTAVLLATVLGALLPFAVVLLLVGAPAWLLLRRHGRSRRTTAPPAGEA